MVCAARPHAADRHDRTLVGWTGDPDTRETTTGTLMPSKASPITTDRAQAPPFGCVWAQKLRIPAPRPGRITRNAVVNRLRSASVPVVTIVAPAGYGKTTALTQWAIRDERPFAWVTLDERDDDPIVLLRHVAAALDGLHASGAFGGESLAIARGFAVGRRRAPKLASALASLESPCVLVLDRSSCLRSKALADVVSALAEHVPDGSTLVLAGRSSPPVPVAALRASGRLLEIGPAVLALSEGEAEALLEASGVELSHEQVASLVGRTEGWAAGLYLAALA